MANNNIFENYVLLQEIMDDDLDFNIIFEGVQQLVQPPAVIAPKRVVPVRNEDYYEAVIPSYNWDDFQAHFRMSRRTFQILQNQLQQLRPANVQEIIPFEKKLLFTIWSLSKPESFIAAGDRFDMAKSTSHNIFFEIITLITNLRHNNISWPNLNERERISRTLENRSGIPGIIGAIDGCHIAIKAPPHNAVDYYNRNNYHSVILQAACNDKRQFTDIFVGTPGRVHDARVFRTSPLYDMLTDDAQPTNQNEHLLGDAAYPLLPFLLKPYRDNGHLTNVQVRFNTRMSSVRSLIEQAFGLLKGKFRRLKYLDMARIDMVPSVITAACVLHNMIITNDGFDAQDAEEDIDHQGQNADLPLDGQRNNIAERKRDYIASLLH